jgi:hypothetical protein
LFLVTMVDELVHEKFFETAGEESSHGDRRRIGQGAQVGFALEHPGPNPARVSVALRFATERDADVRLSIFDAQGRLVRVLESGARPAGRYATSWDLRDQRGRKVAAGLYFAKLESGSRSAVEKVVTLR